MTRCRQHTKGKKDENYTEVDNHCEIHNDSHKECYPCHLKNEHVKTYISEEEYLKDIEKPKMIAKTKEEREAERIENEKKKKEDKK